MTIMSNKKDNTTDDAQKPEKEEKKDPLTEAQGKAQEYLEGWQRCQADYQNLQKETEQRVADAARYGTEQLLMELIQTVDHFTYAFAGIPEEEKESSWLKGIEYIQTNFLKVLEEHGVEFIKTVGEELNTDLHEAVEEVEAEGESGTIAEEVASGFTLNGKVIRCAKVKVIK